MSFPNKQRVRIAVAFALLLTCGSLLYVAKQDILTAPTTLQEYVGTPEYKTVDPDNPSGKSSVFEIAGRTFRMPTVYIQSNLAGKRVLDDGINLLYVLPEYTSRADFKNRKAYEQARRVGRFAHMMLEKESARPSFDVMITNRRNGLTKEENVGNHDGLEFYKWYHGTKEHPVVWYEIYLERDAAGQIQSFIECTPLQRGAHVKSPGCSHKFRDKGILYNIYYDKERYFAAWRDQRHTAIAFIDAFEIEPENPNPKEN